MAEGVRFRFMAAPAEIIPGEDGKSAEKLRLQLMAAGEPDAGGRRRSVPVEGQFDTVKADSVIAAIGQKVEWGKLLDGSRVGRELSGTVRVNSVTYQTAEPDIFAGGDAVTGPKFVIDAIAAGKEGAISIHRFVHEGQSLTIGRLKKDYQAFNKDLAQLGGFDKAPRQKTRDGSASKARDTFKDLRGTLSEKQVLKETERCLGCGATVVDPQACVGCGICTTKCKFDAIHLIRVTDRPGEDYEKLMLRSGENAVKRLGSIAIKKIGLSK